MNASSSSAVSSPSPLESASSKEVLICSISSSLVSSELVNSSKEMLSLSSTSATHKAISGETESSMSFIDTSKTWRPSTDSAGVKTPIHSTNVKNSIMAIGSMSSLLSAVSSAIAAITSVCVVAVLI